MELEVVSPRLVLRRFFKLAMISAAIGAVHIVTLLTSWYTITVDSIAKVPIHGYTITESLLMSSVGGILCGVALLLSSYISQIQKARYIVGSVSLAGAISAALSPTYAQFILIPNLQVEGYMDIGIFISYFSAIAMLIPAAVILATHIVIETESHVPSRIVTMPEVPHEEVVELIQPMEIPAGAVCGICYQEVEPNTTLMCSNCQTLFHQGCIDVWVKLNGNCPNCKKYILR